MPQLGDTKLITIDGHDHAASVLHRQIADTKGYSPRFWLTPSGKILEEGARYELQWRERFRPVRGSAGPGRAMVWQLEYQGKWEVNSEALDDELSLPAS